MIHPPTVAPGIPWASDQTRWDSSREPPRRSPAHPLAGATGFEEERARWVVVFPPPRRRSTCPGHKGGIHRTQPRSPRLLSAQQSARHLRPPGRVGRHRELHPRRIGGGHRDMRGRPGRSHRPAPPGKRSGHEPLRCPLDRFRSVDDALQQCPRLITAPCGTEGCLQSTLGSESCHVEAVQHRGRATGARAGRALAPGSTTR